MEHFVVLRQHVLGYSLVVGGLEPRLSQNKKIEAVVDDDISDGSTFLSD